MTRLPMFILLLAASAFSGQSVLIPGGVQGVVSGITGFDDYTGPLRVEARFQNCESISPNVFTSLLNASAIEIRWQASRNLLEATFAADTGPHPQVSIAGAADFAMRAQRDPLTRQTHLEMWDVRTGRYAADTKAKTTFRPRTIDEIKLGGGAGCSVAFVRVYDWVVSRDSPPPMAAPSGGNALDLEFEGNGDDQSGQGRRMRFSSATSYVITPSYPPICHAGQTDALRAGVPMELDGSRSYPSDDSSLAYFWQSSTAPEQAALEWSSHTSPNPMLTGTVFGTYVFMLSVTDASGRRSTCEVTHGAVATDNNGIVITGNPGLDIILGPMIRWGATSSRDRNPNPYPWMDDRHKHLSEYFGAMQGRQHQAAWLAQLQGTVMISNTANPTKLYGTGTRFQHEYCGGDSTPDGAIYPVVWYTLPTGEQGRYIGVNNGSFISVVTCDSDTELTLSHPWGIIGTSDAQHSLMSSSDLSLWHTSESSINYYDDVLAHYAMYYRSGLEAHRNYARWLADAWVAYTSVNWGYRTGPYGSPGSPLPPRKGASIGILLRALDGKPEYMAVFRRQISAWRSQLKNPLNPVGEREYGYRLLFTALCALFDTGPGGEASACRNDIIASFNRVNGWKALQRPNGIWEAPVNGFGAGTVTVESGGTIVTGIGTNFSSNRSPLWICGNPCTANDSGDSRVYTSYTVDSPTQITLAEPYQGTSGAGKRWMAGASYKNVGFGTQPFMMGIIGTGMYLSWKALDGYNEAEATWARQTMNRIAEWLANTGYRPAAKGLFYARGFPNCEPDPESVPLSQGECVSASGIGASRGLTPEITRVMSESYLDRLKTEAPDASVLKQQMNVMMEATWLKPGTERLQGPYSDGTYWSYNLEVLNLGSGKWLGFPFGMGFSAAWPAARLGGLKPLEARVVRMNTGLGGAAGTSQVRITVRDPNGKDITQEACFSSLCPVTVDARLGNHLVRVEHLSPDGHVIQTTSWKPLIVTAARNRER